MTQPNMRITKVEPTIFIANHIGILQRLVRVSIDSPTGCTGVTLRVVFGLRTLEWVVGSVVAGVSHHEVYVDDSTRAQALTLVLKIDGSIQHEHTLVVQPVPRWRVHVVQSSHHDLGYTDLPSNVLRGHDRSLTEAIEMASATTTYPPDAQFRIVIEQVWSLQHFLNGASSAQSSEMIRLLQTGQFELTAMYGNMITELCGHEELVRSLYPAFRLKREYGIPLVSAEHNDITGISWGVAQVLTDVGVRIFIPGLPLYYGWGGLGLESFWDEQAIFERRGPGAFWWEAPSGKRILFWCNNSGCGGDCHASLPGLTEVLERLPGQGYPFDVLRWPVIGAARDNSPYILGYADTIRQWNEKWAYPHLISSTNALFYADFIHDVKATSGETHAGKQVALPAHRGEMPGQDYPVGATSTAAATAVNRNTHSMLVAAEKLATIAKHISDYAYQTETISDAYDDALIHDEHSWGHHFPAGPAARASEYEKAVHAYRGAALAHDVLNQSMARIADHVKVMSDAPALVVFNLSNMARSDIVRAPLRELDNCGSTINTVPPELDKGETGYLRGVLLHDRWHVNLPPDIIAGHFRVVDAKTGENVPHQIIALEPSDTQLFAAERNGIGSGTARYGMFELPIGMKLDLCFLACDVPANGYKTYQLVAVDEPPVYAEMMTTSERAIENEFYKVTVDVDGTVVSIFDKDTRLELVDAQSPHPFGSLVVRDPFSHEWSMERTAKVQCESGPVVTSLHTTASTYGHPAIHQTITLFSGVKRIEMAVRILKDSIPLLDAHLAFPFLVRDQQFTYEGSLAVMKPITDYLPGSQSDRIAAQNWVRVANDDISIVWTAMDAPIVSLGNLWPGYVSPAHRCVVGDDVKSHHRLTNDDMQHGWIYSSIFYNNLGTNFSVSQNGDHLFRYAFTTQRGRMPTVEAVCFGMQVTTPLQQIFARGLHDCDLAVSGQPISVAGQGVVLLALKQAEDGRGVIVRLWNTSDARTTATINLHRDLAAAWRTTCVEEDLDQMALSDKQNLSVVIEPHDLVTVRIDLHVEG